MSRNLIAYYSRKGQNYLNGNIVNLQTGNTELVARKIQSIVGGEFFKIDTINPYPEDYTETTTIARNELNSGVRPELAEKPENLDDFDTIYLGYPNWWGTFPMVVYTFLEAYDFSGKTIIPFCTHEGSGLGSSIQDIKKFCPGAIVHKGIAIRGGNVNDSDHVLKSWLQELKIK